MLIEQRRRPAHAHRRQRQAHRRAGRFVFADHRMIDLLHPLTDDVLLTVDELADGVERRGGEMARLGLIGKIIGIELTDKFGERLARLRRNARRDSAGSPTRARRELCSVIQFCANSFHICGMLVVKWT